MPAAKKEDLMKKLIDLGEAVPKSWTKAQVQARLLELDAENPQAESLLDQAMARLKKAHRTGKQDLINHMKRDLKMTMTGNETMTTLMQKGTEHIHKLYPSQACDYLQFGKHGDLTYGEVSQQDPAYVAWAVTTLQEGPSSWQLTRFATWAHKQALDKEVKQEQRQPQPQMSAGGSSNSSWSHVKKEVKEESPTEESKDDLIQRLQAELADATQGHRKERREM